MKVAIIGAGAAGLCCTRYLSQFPRRFQIRVFEKMAAVGGTWLYTENTGRDEHGLPVHTCMYKHLRTNLPKEIMAFAKFPFEPSLPSFPYHWDVLEYLKKFATHFDLNKFIQFRTLVEKVVPIPIQGQDERAHSTSRTGLQSVEAPDTDGEAGFSDNVKWRVTTRSAVTGDRATEDYDAVVVCNGHFFQPAMPAIAGLEDFPGEVIHSHSYREPMRYKNQRVLVVGAGSSGKDISLELSDHAASVFLCNIGPTVPSTLPSNIEQLPAIASIQSDGTVCFINGKERCTDSIILCTGYHYAFPFLTEESGIRVENKRIMRLYKHTFNVVHPSMAIMGVNFQVTPFPYFDLQALWILSVWSGQKQLPLKAEMIQDSDQEYRSRLQEGLPPHYAHRMGSKQWAFFNELAQLGGSEPLDPVIQTLYEEAAKGRRYNLTTYRSKNYRILSKEEWIEIDKTTTATKDVS